MPLMKGSNRLITAPRMRPQSVGGWYRIMAGDPDEGGDVDSSSAPEYCSLSERTVTPDSAIGFVGSSEDIVRCYSRWECCCSGSTT